MRSVGQYIVRFFQHQWLLLLILAAAWLLLRTRSSGAASVEEFDRKIQSGQPVVVELFTNT
jgi:hypothetical protein